MLANQYYLSIVVPTFNEEESILELVNKIDEVCKQNDYSHEIIFVDDGSTDKSLAIINKTIETKAHVKCISFGRNFGKSAALAEGFNLATGEIIISMDADLQDDPQEITALVRKINEGYDLVSGWKKQRNDPISKTLPSKLFNYITSLLSGIKLHDFNCGLKAYRRCVAKSINIYGEMHRFLPVLAHCQGYKITEIPVTHHKRKHGKSKFGAKRFLSGIFDLVTVLFITKYKRKPMHVFGMLGLTSLTVGSCALIYLTVLWFMGYGIGNRPLLSFGILAIIVGIQFFGIGLLGELITLTSQKADDRPPARLFGFKSDATKEARIQEHVID